MGFTRALRVLGFEFGIWVLQGLRALGIDFGIRAYGLKGFQGFRWKELGPKALVLRLGLNLPLCCRFICVLLDEFSVLV